MIRRLARSRGIIFIAVLLATMSSVTLHAQDPLPDGVLLEELLQETEARFQWDPYRRQGALVRGGRILSFQLGTSVAVEDLVRMHSIEAPRRDQGTIVFGSAFRDLSRRVFPPVTQERRIAAIFIDPGHGGRDPGAIGQHRIDGEQRQLQEKDVVLAVGAMLRDQLARRYPDKEIVLSRDRDVYLTLEERTTRANAIEVEPNESVIFISLHANASLNRGAQGFEVWFLPPEFRRRNLVSAEDTGVNDPDVLSILNTMREEEITLESVLLARNVLSGMEAMIGSESPNRGLREESWYVVRNAKMPSILVEVGFVTNQEEFLRLTDDQYLRRVTEGIYTGVVNFVRSFEDVDDS